MKKKYPMINIRGVIYLLIAALVLVAATDYFLVKMMTGGSKLWILPMIVSMGCLFMSIMGIISVTSVGIDVKDGKVWLPDTIAPKNCVPAFELADLEEIHLEDSERETVPNSAATYAGCRVIFTLKNGKRHEYYPMMLGKRQYLRLYNGLTAMIK